MLPKSKLHPLERRELEICERNINVDLAYLPINSKLNGPFRYTVCHLPLCPKVFRHSGTNGTLDTIVSRTVELLYDVAIEEAKIIIFVFINIIVLRRDAKHIQFLSFNIYKSKSCPDKI